MSAIQSHHVLRKFHQENSSEVLNAQRPVVPHLFEVEKLFFSYGINPHQEYTEVFAMNSVSSRHKSYLCQGAL